METTIINTLDRQRDIHFDWESM